MICQLAREAKTKARKAPVERPDAKVEPFNMAGANLVNVRLAGNGSQYDARAFGLTVTVVWVNSTQDLFAVAPAINLLHHSKVKTA